MLGLYGVAISTLAILIHLTNIRSFGIPYLSPVAPQTPRDLKDVFLRTPRWNMTHRPIMVSGEEKVRFPGGQKPDEKREGKQNEPAQGTLYDTGHFFMLLDGMLGSDRIK